MALFNLRAVTPDKVFFDGQIENIILRTTAGDKGILAQHEPYVAALPLGAVRIKSETGWRNAAISGGSVKVSRGGNTVILAQSLEWSDEIDLKRAEEAKDKAEKRINNSSGDYDLQLAEMKLKRALNRISTAGLKITQLRTGS